MARLKDLYKSRIIPELTERFGYKNPMAVPRMEKVIVSNYSISAGAGDKPMENLSLSYGKVKYTYIDQTKDKGTAGGAKPISHDLTINKVE